MVSEKMSATGISKKTFTVGILIVFLASLLVNYAISSTVIKAGPRRSSGGVEPDVTASLTSSYTGVSLGTDYHDVEGLVINFGNNPAYSVTVTITWHITGWHKSCIEHTEPAVSIGTLSGHGIYEFSKRFYFEDSYDYITWEITWS